MSLCDYQSVCLFSLGKTIDQAGGPETFKTLFSLIIYVVSYYGVHVVTMAY